MRAMGGGTLEDEEVVVGTRDFYLGSLKFDMHVTYPSGDVESAVRHEAQIDISFSSHLLGK